MNTSFCKRYIRFAADGARNADGSRMIDEAETKRKLERRFDLQPAPPGALAEFMIRAYRDDLDCYQFKEAIELFNNDLQHARHVKTLAEKGVRCPADFLKYTDEFVQHFCDNQKNDRETALLMLELKEGDAADWTRFEGYDRFGVDLMDMFVSTLEELDEEAEENSRVIREYHESIRAEAARRAVAAEAARRAVDAFAREKRQAEEMVTVSMAPDDIFRLGQMGTRRMVDVRLTAAELKRFREF